MAKWFGNDKDGLTLAEFSAIIILASWVSMTVYYCILLYFEKLTSIAVDFYAMMMWLPLLVISGLFGQKIVGNIGSRKINVGAAIAEQENTNQEQK